MIIELIHLNCQWVSVNWAPHLPTLFLVYAFDRVVLFLHALFGKLEIYKARDIYYIVDVNIFVLLRIL